MKKITALISALAIIVSTVSVVPVGAVTETDYSQILESQLDMPVVAIETVNSISSKDSYVDAFVTMFDEKGQTNLDTTDISIRLRGNSSLELPKKSYRFKFASKQNPLNVGDASGKSWNLVANYYDNSLMRNMTAYHIGDMLEGMAYTPNSKPVEVYLNGQYQGVYLLCEAVNINKNRVAITESPDAVEENGYLIEMSRYEDENYFDVEYERFVIKNDLSEDTDIKNKQKEYIADYTQKAYDALKSGDKAVVEKYIDIDSMVDNYIANEIAKNIDAGWDSFYMYKDAGGLLQFGPMWDYDLAFGNAESVKGFTSSKGLCAFNVANVNANSNPWFCYALKHEWFRQSVEKRWNEKIAEISSAPDFVKETGEEYIKAFENNFIKWPLLGTQVYTEPESISKLKTYKEHNEYLSDWLDDRIKWLDSYFNSDDFDNAVFPDENGLPITGDSNLIEYCTLMVLGSDDSKITDSPGFVIPGGSSSPWGTQAIAVGMILEKGTKYRLSFDYSSTDSTSVSYNIQQNYAPWKSYAGGSTTAKTETQHVEKEFTASVNDSNCGLSLQVRGSGTITFENISLVKVNSDIEGDVNGDGSFNVSDVVSLVRWLMCCEEMPNQQAGDIDKNGIINIVDLIMIKSNLTK